MHFTFYYWIHSLSYRFISVIEPLDRQPNSVGTALLRFKLSFFLPELATRRTRRGRQSNAHRRFGRRRSSNNGPRDLAHPSLNFYRGQKVRNLASCLTSLKFEASAFENAARYLNSETNSVSRDDGRMTDVCPLQVWWSSVHAPLRSFRGNATHSRISRQ